MNFIFKAYLQRIMSGMYKGEKMNYMFQKYVTRSLPISNEDLVKKVEIIKSHLCNFSLHSGKKDFKDCNYYEFGTGYDLLIPLVVSMSGFRKLTCVDVRELVLPELLNDSFQRLYELKEKLNLNLKYPADIPLFTKKNFKLVLKDYLKIEYRAPESASNTNMEDESVDFILSNATFEHIPEKSIKDILTECYRVLKPGGIVSNAIDYRDHWSFFDKSISCYNYLKFSEKEWEKYNPSIMYQNRLRHKDYIRFIKEAGFKILNVSIDLPDQEEIKRFDELDISDFFKKNYSKEDLIIKSGFIILQK